jgi:hypothetical protein
MLNDFPETPTQFQGKIWIYVAQAAVFGGLGMFSLVMGPLFLFGALKKADGTPATDAGIALCSMTVPFFLIFAFAMFNIRVRRLPVLQLFREGLEIVLIGTSSLDQIPLPALIRIAWSIVSTEGFRTKVVRVPWECFRGVEVSGVPMARQLSIFKVPGDGVLAVESPLEAIVLQEVLFKAPLEQIAHAIKVIANSSEASTHLPSWRQSTE